MIDRSEESILPLINIVFLLLIFFMVVGQLTPADDWVEQPLESTAGQEPAAAAQPPLTLQMSATGELALEGVAMGESALLSNLTGADSRAVHGLVLKVDGRTEATAVIRLLTRLRESGVPDVRLLTLRGDGAAPAGVLQR